MTNKPPAEEGMRWDMVVGTVQGLGARLEHEGCVVSTGIWGDG